MIVRVLENGELVEVHMFYRSSQGKQSVRGPPAVWNGLASMAQFMHPILIGRRVAYFWEAGMDLLIHIRLIGTIS